MTDIGPEACVYSCPLKKMAAPPQMSFTKGKQGLFSLNVSWEARQFQVNNSYVDCLCAQVDRS